MPTSEDSMLVTSRILKLVGIAPSGAASGAICVLIGQQVLLAANSDGSSWSAPLAGVACIGAVGGAISSTPLILYVAVKIRSDSPISAPVRVAIAVLSVVTFPAFAATAGAIGASVLDLHGGSVLSVGKASEAGVLGYVVGLAAVIAFIVAVSVILMPAVGFAWMFDYCKLVRRI